MVDIVFDDGLEDGSQPSVKLPSFYPSVETSPDTEQAPVVDTTTSDAGSERLVGIQTAQLDGPEKVFPPVTETVNRTKNNSGFFGRNPLTDNLVKEIESDVDFERMQLEGIYSRNKKSPFAISDEEIYNRYLRKSAARNSNFNEDKKINADNLNSVYNVPVFNSDAEAESSIFLKDGEVYYVKPPEIPVPTSIAFENVKVLGKYSTRSYRDNKTTIEKIMPHLKEGVDAVSSTGYATIKQGTAAARGLITGAVENPANLLLDIFFGLKKLPVSEGVDLGIDYAFAFDLWTSDNQLEEIAEKEDYDKSLKAFIDKYKSNANEKKLRESEINFKQTMKDFSGWMDDLPAFYGTNTKEYFAGRVAETFGEELPIVRLLAWMKFRNGLKLAEDGNFGGLQYSDPVELAKALNITEKQARIKLGFIKKGYNDPKVYALYKLREMDMAFSFATGYNTVNTWINDKKNDIPEDSPLLSLNFALEMTGGFGSSILGLGRQTKNIGNKYRFRSLAVLYHMSDALKSRGLKEDIKEVRFEAMLKEAQESGSGGKNIDAYKQQDYNRKYAFLRAMGFSDDQIKTAKKEGQLEQLQAQTLTMTELGKNFNKFKERLQLLPEVTRKALKKTVDANFKALSTITKYAQSKGIFIGTYLDDILELSRLHDAKIRLAKSQGSSWKNMYSELFGNEDILKQEKNAVLLREQIKEYIEEIKYKYNDPEVDFHDDAKAFINEIVELGDHVLAKSKLTNLEITNDLVRGGLDITNRPQTVRDNASKSLMPNIGDTKATAGVPILAKDNADRSKAIMEKLKEDEREIQDRLWDSVSADYDHTFDANPFVDELKDRFLNTGELPALHAILNDALKKGSVSKLIQGMKDRFLKEQDVDSLIDLIADSAKPLDGSGFDVDKDTLVNRIKENFNQRIMSGELSPEQQFDILAETVESMGLISNELTMLDIKLLNSHLGKKGTKLQSTDGRGEYLHNLLKEILYDKVLANEALPQPSVDVLVNYHRAIEAYKSYADKFLRGPVGGTFRKTPYGDLIINPEQIMNELVQKSGSVVSSSQVLEDIVTKKPVINKTTGEVEYVSISDKDREELEELILQSIWKNIELETLEKSTLDSMLELPFYQKIFNKRGKQVISNLKAYRDDLTHKNVIQDNEASAALANIQRITKELVDSQQRNINDGILSVLSKLKGTESSAEQIVSFFFNDNALIRLKDLSKAQENIASELLQKETYGTAAREQSTLAIADRVSKRFIIDSKDTTQVMATPFEAMFILTEGFTLVKNRIDPKDTTQVIEEKVGEKMFKSLKNIIAHGIVDAAYTTSTRKVVKKGENTLEKEPDMVTFFDILDKTKRLREGTGESISYIGKEGKLVTVELPPLFGPEVNEILESGKQALITTEGKLARTEAGDRFTADVPTPTSISARMSRMWSWARGFVGLRWIMGESAINDLRKRQAAGLLEVLTNPNSAQLVNMFLDNRYATPEALKGRMGPALRALSIVTGVRVTELERWFEHTDHPNQVDANQVAFFIRNGKVMPKTQINMYEYDKAKMKLGGPKMHDFLRNMEEGEQKKKKEREKRRQDAIG